MSEKQEAEKPGLTFGEKRRLLQLKKILAGSDKESSKPTTSQKTITFEQMYPDGICHVKKNYYTKMVEFYHLLRYLEEESG